MTESRLLELLEYERCTLMRDELDVADGLRVHKDFSTQITIDFPTPKVDDQWVLQARGWVGQILLTQELTILLKPKVPLERLFEMLEVAYRLKSFRFLSGLTDCASIAGFYDRLASVLSKRVLDRGRKGYYREYVQEHEALPYVCGRVDLHRTLRTPWRVRVPCDYEEHTGDIIENRILTWTLSRISKSSACRDHTLRTVRRAYREVSGVSPAAHVTASDCVDRLYTRLNDDYGPLHALCRFFLEQAGPTQDTGDRRTLPFLVDMARLFELFVAEWMKSRLDSRWLLRDQHTLHLDHKSGLHFIIDLVLVDQLTGRTACVLDTKYKATDRPLTTDIQAIIAYAVAQECRDAVLIYPSPLSQPFDDVIGGIRVRSLCFDLSGDLELAGRRLLIDLGVL